MRNGPSLTNDRTPTSFKLASLGSLAILSIILFVLHPVTPHLSGKEVAGLIAFLVLAIFSESYPLGVSIGRANLSVSGTIYWALIVLFDPYWTVLCVSLSLMFSEFLIQRKELLKSFFNTSQVGISAALGSITFNVIQGSTGLEMSWTFALAFMASVIVYWVFNTSVVSLAMYVLYASNPYRFWRQNFQWALAYELTSAPIALALAIAYEQLWVIGLVLLALPTFMIRLAYSQYLELKKTYRETVRTLVKVIEMHDPYTAGHSDRVAIYARSLCECLRLSPSKAEKIEMAAYLHDLGKIHLDLTGIVRKAGRLTEEERRIVRLHSVLSADLACQVSYFRGEIEGMIRHHHENWDGSGYPHGLQGTAIPQGSRIILIADAFDAMTTSRVYREALDLERVKAEFRKFSGIQFDPGMVSVFLEDCVGDGSNMIRQPLDEPIEGQRAHSMESSVQRPSVTSASRSALGIER